MIPPELAPAAPRPATQSRAEPRAETGARDAAAAPEADFALLVAAGEAADGPEGEIPGDGATETLPETEGAEEPLEILMMVPPLPEAATTPQPAQPAPVATPPVPTRPSPIAVPVVVQPGNAQPDVARVLPHATLPAELPAPVPAAERAVAAKPKADTKVDAALPVPEVAAEAEAPPGRSAAAAPGPALAAPRPVTPHAAASPAVESGLQPALAADWRLIHAARERHAAPERAAPLHGSAQDVAGQITLAVSRATEGRVEIRLDPPELGRVQIRLDPSADGLQATVMAERPETQDFLRRHSETLIRELTAAGYADVSLEFASGGEAASREDGREARGYAVGFDAQPDANSTVAATRQARPGGGLDIRL